jgi:hypothetical protein
MEKKIYCINKTKLKKKDMQRKKETAPGSYEHNCWKINGGIRR